MAMFKAFKPAGMEKIARSMGYQGNMQGFQNYLAQDPMRQQQMQGYQQKAMQMAQGGVVRKMQTGGMLPDKSKTFQDRIANLQDTVNKNRMYGGINLDNTTYNVRDSERYGRMPQLTYQYGDGKTGAIRLDGAEGRQAASQYSAYTQAKKDLEKARREFDAFQKEQPTTPPQLVDPRLIGAGPGLFPGETAQPGGGLLPISGQPAVIDPRGPQGGTISSQATYGTAVGPENNRAPGSMEDRLVSDLPDFQAFKDWQSKNTTPRISSAVMVTRIGPDGKQINFSNPVEAEDYDNYLRSTGQQPTRPTQLEAQSLVQSTPNITSGDYRGIPFDPNAMRIQMDTNYGQPLMSADGTMGTMNTQQPDYSGMTYEQAQSRLMQRDIKSPAEQAAIDAAIARGVRPQAPGGPVQKSNPYTGGPGLLPGEYGDVFPEASVPPMYGPEGTYSLTGGPDPNAPPVQGVTPAVNVGGLETAPATIGDATTQRMYNPALPQGGVTQAAMTPTGPGQEIAQGTGQLTGAVAVPTAMAGTATASPQQESQANVMEAATAAPAVDAAMNATQAAQGTVDPRAQVTAAQQTATSVGNLSAAQGNATLIDNPVQRNIQAGELITGAADAQTAATFTEQVQAATATPSTQATVQGQLASLTANFDAANPPAWAAGAMRNATAAMAARGLGASSLAGQAIVQATLESALPIAQADAATVAQFEAQNLSNRQQRAMLSAQQRAQFIGQEFDQAFQSRVQNSARIGDIANMNFTAEQQVQLENSRAVNTMNLNNLSNSQAMVMAEAAALAQMDAANLNNRQQSAVQNAQAFLQTDMANLSNQQQTDLFKAQSRIQSLFTDQAAANAARQFNASSQNQVDQFFANLGQQTSQFNATQQNAQSQFNAGQANTVNRFNAEMNNQRDQFNAQNQIVISQSNAQWRRQIATADTAAVNRANELNAAAILDVSKEAYDNLWNYYSDVMEWAWTTGENDKDRITQMALGELSAKTSADMAKLQLDAAESGAIGGFFSDILTSQAGSIAGKFFGL